jgi:hypothetical protein
LTESKRLLGLELNLQQGSSSNPIKGANDSMLRVKMLIGLVGIFATLALSATPALAEWQAKGQWKGVVKVTNSGELISGTGATEGTIKCQSNEIEAQWSIQTKGPISEHEKQGKQVQTKTGPHLWIKITKWGSNCTTAIGATKLPVTIKPCEIQLVQVKGALTATAGIASECIITAAPCEIKIPQTSETVLGSNTGTNVGLKEVKLENKSTKEGTKQNDKANVEGITTVVSGTGCPLLGNTTASLKGFEFEIENVAAI